MSAGFMLAMSPWMTCPTFSSTLIFLSSVATFSSSASSFANGHFGDGQISGCTAAGSLAFTSGLGVSFVAFLQPTASNSGRTTKHQRSLDRTGDMEGGIEKLLFLGADSLCCLSPEFEFRWAVSLTVLGCAARLAAAFGR